MTHVPLSKGQASSFMPASFANLAEAPSFRFRAPTPYDREDYRYALREEGLRFWSSDEFRAEIISGLTEMWAGDEDLLNGNINRLKAFWELEDQAEKDPTLTVDEQEAVAVKDLLLQLMDAWPILNRMNADNLKFSERAPKVALRMYLAGWKNLDVPFRLEAGKVPVESIFALSDALEAVEKEAASNKVEGIIPGVGFMQLTSHAIGLMNLGSDAEKNSPSPSAAPAETSGSMEPSPPAKPSRSGRTGSRRAKTPAKA